MENFKGGVHLEMGILFVLDILLLLFLLFFFVRCVWREREREPNDEGRKMGRTEMKYFSYA